jgi:anti-sigma factor RsiW
VTCRDVHAFLSDWRTGGLPRETREAFALHLDACASCLAYVDSYEKTIALAKRAGFDDGDAATPPEALENAILASLRAGSDLSSSRSRVRIRRRDLLRR